MRTVSLSLLFMMLQPLTAGAICPNPSQPRVCADFFANDLVFTGKVLSARYLEPERDNLDPSHQGGWVYSVKVHQVYRGSMNRTVEVYTENTDIRYPLDAGKSYLLFAARGGLLDKTVLEIFGCDLNDRLSKARPSIRKIEEILHARPGAGGYIGGGFAPTGGGFAGDTTDLGGIRITARDDGKTYETVTAKDGSWDMWVPAGTYNLRANSPHWYISPDDWRSLYPFKHIVIHDGGCADVEFSGMRLMN